MSKAPPKTVLKNKSTSNNEQGPLQEELVAINGFQQIVDMLKAADPQFRDSLLKRLAQRDSKMTYSLKQRLD